MHAEAGTASLAVRATASLLINVSSLLQEPIGAVRRYRVDNARALGLDGAVHGSLRLLRTDQSVLATAALTTATPDICGSCLREVELPIEVAFDEEFWPSIDAISGQPVEPPQERIGFAVIDGQIDLSEAVRQYVEMKRPMSPRCGADCPGPDTSAPAEPPLDARWAALSDLRSALPTDAEGD